MGVKWFKTKLSKIKNDTNFRFDVKYGNFLELSEINLWNYTNCCELKHAMKQINSPIMKKGELDTEEYLIDLSNIERKRNNLINLEKVVEIGSDKSIIKFGDIIIPKIEPKKGQFFLNLNHNEYIGSTELVEYEINKEEFNPYFLYYILISDKFLRILSFLESGKTHKRVSYENILKIKIPRVPIKFQNELAIQIQPIETEITNLKESKLKPLDIINQVFGEAFDISMDFIDELDKTNKLIVKFSDIHKNNSNLRNGMRWNKMQFIQNKLYEKIDCVKVLGNYIKTTKNGWSPLSVEDGEGTPVLGQEHFAFDGKLKIEASKFTEESRNSIEEFYIKKRDFFVSRGNTLDLVALASIVQDEIIVDILFPDLYIKIEFEEKDLNKEYIAYLFNSFFGRLYFKYVAKGKNQTMVKISAIELLNFRFPLPNIKTQAQIVEKIKNQIDAQNIIDQQIEEKQQQINEIIENAIKSE
jgi:type I restriction enzyme, S subunit